MDTVILNQIKEVVAKNPSLKLREVAEEVGCAISTVHKAKKLIALEEQSEVEKEQDATVAQQLKIQKLQDSNRIERKLFRQEARKLNESNSLFEEMLKLLRSTPVWLPDVKEPSSDTPVLAIGLSDLHFGETVALRANVVDTSVLSQRLFKYVTEAVKAGVGFGCERAVFFITGDLCNSSRRPSEFLSNEFTVAHAAVNAIEIITQMISLVSHTFKVTDVVSVCGNESTIRLQDNQFGYEPKMIFSNFDYIIHESLRQVFPTVRFSNWGNPIERVVTINGRNIVLTHGITLAKKSPEHILNYYRIKYGNDIHFVICGHVHESCVTPFFSRSASPVGGNCYSELSLGIATSIPSQTYHLISPQGIISVPVELATGLGDMFEFTKCPKSSEVIDTKLSL